MDTSEYHWKLELEDWYFWISLKPLDETDSLLMVYAMFSLLEMGIFSQFIHHSAEIFSRFHSVLIIFWFRQIINIEIFASS